MKNRLAAMILAEPAGPQLHGLGLALGTVQKNLLQFRKPFRKIGKDSSGNFALIASRTKDARHQDPSWSFQAQWKLGAKSGRP